MTVSKAGNNIYSFPRRVPLPEVYSVSENSHVAYANETERPSVEVTLVRGGVEVDEVVVSFGPVMGGLLSFERSGVGAAISDAGFGDNIHDPTQRTGS